MKNKIRTKYNLKREGVNKLKENSIEEKTKST